MGVLENTKIPPLLNSNTPINPGHGRFNDFMESEPKANPELFWTPMMKDRVYGASLDDGVFTLC